MLPYRSHVVLYHKSESLTFIHNIAFVIDLIDSSYTIQDM